MFQVKLPFSSLGMAEFCEFDPKNIVKISNNDQDYILGTKIERISYT